MTSTLLGAGETDRAKPNPCPESDDNPEDRGDNNQITEHTHHMSGTDGCRAGKNAGKRTENNSWRRGRVRGALLFYT